MLSAANEYDVYVTAAGAEAVRKSSLNQLAQLHPVDGARAAAFIAGERILLRERISDAEVQRMQTGLRALGVRVDVEMHREPLALAELDSFSSDEPRAAVAVADNPFFNVGAGLVGLDGEDDSPPPAPSHAAPAGGALLGGLFSATLSDADEPLAPDQRAAPMPPPPASRAPAAPPPPTPRAPAPLPPKAVAPKLPSPSMPPPHAIALARPAPPAPPAPAIAPRGDGRFAPVGADDGSTNLMLDVTPPDPMLSAPPPASETTFVAPRCPTHDVPKVHSRCPKCDEEEAAVRGRFFAGRLRANPALRVGIGLAAGIFLGWIITAPMARKGERHVDELREAAQRERARPTEEGQAQAKVLDAQADEESNNAFIRTLGVWALIAGSVTAGWYRLT